MFNKAVAKTTVHTLRPTYCRRLKHHDFMKALLSILILACVVGCFTTKPAATGSSEQSSAIPSLKMAEQLYREGQFDSAELALRAILLNDPKNQEARYYLELVYRAEAEVVSRQSRRQGYYQTIPQQPIY